MTPLFALFLAAQAPMEQPPRLRTVLPNGAVILVERLPHAKSLVVDLLVSSRGTEETPQSQGRRHLLEHLVALGPHGELDTRLETAGGFLTARTMRESTEFDMVLPPDAPKLGIGALKDLISMPAIDAAAIAREARIIEEEGALRDDASRASEAAWAAAYGSNGLDPFGNLEVIRSTTPEDLAVLHRRSFAANHLAVVVSGDVDLDLATRAVSDVLSLLPTYAGAKDRPDVELKTGSVEADVQGQYRGVAVSGYRSPKTAATLAAALALSLATPGGNVIYTPSAHPGLVIVGSAQGGLTEQVERANAAQMFAIGRLAAIRWVSARMIEAESAASYRGMLLVQERDLRPETMLENLEALKYSAFKQAIDEFKSGCVSLEGTR